MVLGYTQMHGAGRYGLLRLRTLDQLSAVAAFIVAAPLKMKEGSGSTLRVLAPIEDTRPTA